MKINNYIIKVKIVWQVVDIQKEIYSDNKIVQYIHNKIVHKIVLGILFIHNQIQILDILFIHNQIQILDIPKYPKRK